jgi:hypothetical protein
VTSFAAETAGKRLAGERPSAMQAFAVACVTAVAAGALTYKILRSGGSDDDD